MISLIGTALSGIFSLVGSGVQGFFGMKAKESDLVNNTIKAFADSNTSAAAREQAIAQIVAQEAQSQYWLAAIWRPLVMIVFAGLIVSYFFGYTTPNLLSQFPPESAIAKLFDLLQTGLMGYIPARTVEKIATSFATTRNLRLLTEYLINNK